MLLTPNKINDLVYVPLLQSYKSGHTILTHRIMDNNEHSVHQFLQNSDFDPQFEPNGPSKFPDFSINDGSIGVEARGLMPNRQGAPTVSLAAADISIWRRIESFLDSIQRGDLPTSFVVRLKFKRPLPAWRIIEKAACAHLMGSIDNLGCTNLAIAENVSLTVTPAEKKKDKPFLFGGTTDLDSARWVVNSIIESISHAIAEKNETERKPSNQTHGFTRLWLILVNQIDNRVTPDEIALIRAAIVISQPWERLILINSASNLLATWISEQGDGPLLNVVLPR